MIYRCCYCRNVVMEKHIAEGGCPQCGARRIQIAGNLTDDEMARAIANGFEYKPEEWAREQSEAWLD